MYAITAKINFAAYLVETISIGSIVAAFYASGSSVLLQHILESAWTFVQITVITFNYLLNDHDFKFIVMGQGWFAGIKSVFLTNAKRQSMIQTITDERLAMRRANALHHKQKKNRPTVHPPSPNQPVNSDNMKKNAETSKNMAPFIDEELAFFKTFYRQSLTNGLLTSYETNPLQFDNYLRHFVELEQMHTDDEYDFSNDTFVALFNEFNLHKKDRTAFLHKSDAANLARKKWSLVTLNARSLFQTANSDIVSILQNLHYNVNNEDLFGKLFGQLLEQQRIVDVTSEPRRKVKTEAVNHESGERREQKDKRSKIKKSRNNNQKIQETPIALISETLNSSVVSTNGNSDGNSVKSTHIKDKLVLSYKKKRIGNAEDGADECCTLNMPDDNSNV